MAKRLVIGGIDVGTTKICTCIAEVQGEDLRILGTGWAGSRGVAKGLIANLSEAVPCIRRSVEEAEEQCGQTLDSAYVSIGGRYLRGYNRVGSTEVRGRQGLVNAEDVQRAIMAAQNGAVPEGAEVIHVLTQSYRLDDQTDVEFPLGMSGRQLSVHVHLVLNAASMVRNVVNAVQQANLAVNGVIMQPLASAEAVLTDDERELGAVLIDIGGGTTDITVYARNAIWYSQVLPIGGSQITKDIAFGLRIPLEDAERLKIEQGHVQPEAVPMEEYVEVREMGSRQLRTYPRRLLCQIIQPRCEEILSACRKALLTSGLRLNLLTGVVLTGGGSLLHGLSRMAERIFEMPVRLGVPPPIPSAQDLVFGPEHATALGLVRYPLRLRGEQAEHIVRAQPAARPRTERLKNWLFERI